MPRCPPPWTSAPSLLTATILFMASSLRESLLVSSISFRSSCLVRCIEVTEDQGGGEVSTTKEGTWKRKAQARA